MKDLKLPVVAPSILSADFSRLGEALGLIEKSGAEWVHLDVMDGVFVSNLTFGPKMIQDLRPRTGLFFDTHLMITAPENLVQEFIQAGSDAITFHWEATIHHHRLVQRIKDQGKQAGISIVPSTPVEILEPMLPFLDIILIMSVNPGFGGQSFLGFTMEKIRWLAQKRLEKGLKFKISVDGGINQDTFLQAVGSGADILVAGSAFFNAPNPQELVKMFKTFKETP